MRKMPGAMRSRPESTAYVPYGNGKHYVCGAFNDGVRWRRGQSERKIPNNWFIRNVMIPGCKVVSVFIPSKKYRNKVKTISVRFKNPANRRDFLQRASVCAQHSRDKINIKTRHSRLDSPTQTFVCAGPGAGIHCVADIFCSPCVAIQ